MLQNFIPYSTQSINEEDKEEVVKALFSTHLTQGKYVKKFETEIAHYIGVKHAISFNSATSALYAAFKALKEYVFQDKYKENDILKNSKNFEYANNKKSISIITTPISFVATTNMMLANNITPIFADINIDGNLNIKNIESLLRDDTIAICSVDYAGNSVNMQEFREFSNRHNLLWISDSSHAFGGSYNDIKVGSMADISVFSFHAVKPLTTCEGGAIVSDCDFFAKIANLICSHGIEKKSLYNHDCIELGFNFRLNEVGASLGLSQLKRLESFIQKREEIARFYDSYLHDNPYCFTIKIQENIKSTRHLYPILLDPSFICRKESIANELESKNIGVQVHYKPIYNFSFYQKLSYKFPILRNAEDFYHAELSIPCHQNMTLDQAKYIADTLIRTFEVYKNK